jgi:hypothetical protein
MPPTPTAASFLCVDVSRESAQPKITCAARRLGVMRSTKSTEARGVEVGGGGVPIAVPVATGAMSTEANTTGIASRVTGESNPAILPRGVAETIEVPVPPGFGHREPRVGPQRWSPRIEGGRTIESLVRAPKRLDLQI